MNGHDWTDEAKQVLQDHYRKDGVKFCTRKLQSMGYPYSYNGVKAKAYRMGLTGDYVRSERRKVAAGGGG